MSINKITAAFMSCVLACCAVFSPFSVPAEHISAAYEGSENPCNRQDDMEVPYDRHSWVQPADWKCSAVDPRDFEGWIMIFADKIGLDLKDAPGKVQRIYISLVGPTEPVSMMKFHMFYDTRLKIKNNSKGEVVTPGKAVTDFTTGSALVKDGEIAFYAYSDKDVVIDRGSLFTIDFIVPENADRGEVYPIGFSYVDDGVVGDTFMNSANDTAGNLQMAFVFTKGMYNGYIKIHGDKRIKGDVNEDEAVNTADFVTLADIILGKTVPAEPRAADLNKDGVTDVQDLLVLKEILRS
ncbi:dockerin type I domain-containing protein [Ruminococcus sp. HUN007]|uniref:dockerin type I domain-containing protein n=1 Tax=Ruminococcus sp. HUN007 TaxID=1514668 RepID=UPI000678B042|nr:dockerin type I domain-containing protein [Ruminococcus sp. HUN007]